MRLTFLVLSLAMVGCTNDYDLEKQDPVDDGGPAIELNPEEVYFGAADVGDELVQSFAINSIGDVALAVEDVRIDGASPFSVTTFEPRGLAPGESTDVVVTYLATGVEDVGEALVFSDDPDSPHTVRLYGGGEVPELTISPSAYDFGYLAIDESAETTFALQNTGGATLQITSVDTTQAVFAYALDGSLPISLEPGEETTVSVTFTPTSGDIYSGLLEVGSTDPEGVKSAELNGGGAGDQPIAVCEADPDVIETLHETTTWKGNASYDPAGYAITDYEWTLVSKPTASTSRIPSGGANRSGFTADLAGTYVAELVVTNEIGERSEPCTATLEAIPGEDLWIEMYWTHSGDDMDLHLLAPSGSLTTNSDCYYGNCTYSALDWGVRGDATDDPSLDLDDIPGTGPENINIEEPESGTFTVYVHDYPGSVYNGTNDVTVNIYVGGALEWTDTRNVNSEDLYEPFAEIEWPSGTVTGL